MSTLRRLCLALTIGVAGCSKVESPTLGDGVETSRQSTKNQENRSAHVQKTDPAKENRKPENIPELVGQLGAKERNTRIAALKSLKRAGPEAGAAGPEITKLLKDKDAIVRIYAASALKHVKPDSKEALPVLIEALRTKEETVRCYAAGAFEGFDNDAIPVLIGLFQEEDQQTASWASCSVASFGSRAVPFLTKVQEDEDRLVREHAQFALKLIKLIGD